VAADAPVLGEAAEVRHVPTQVAGARVVRAARQAKLSWPCAGDVRRQGECAEDGPPAPASNRQRQRRGRARRWLAIAAQKVQSRGPAAVHGASSGEKRRGRAAGGGAGREAGSLGWDRTRGTAGCRRGFTVTGRAGDRPTSGRARGRAQVVGPPRVAAGAGRDEHIRCGGGEQVAIAATPCDACRDMTAGRCSRRPRSPRRQARLCVKPRRRPVRGGAPHGVGRPLGS